MKKAIVLIVFFCFLFPAYAQEKKRVISEETTEEFSSSESSGSSVSKGGGAAKKPVVKKPVVKKKAVIKKSQPSSSKKAASSKRYSKRTVRTRTEEEIEVAKKPEPPKPPPCEVKLLKLEAHPLVADAVVFVGVTPHPGAEVWAEYSIIAEEIDGKIVAYPEVSKLVETQKISTIAGWEVASTSQQLKQKTTYRGRMVENYNGATCSSDPINFQLLRPAPPLVKMAGKEPGKWAKFLTCTGSTLAGFGATTANPGLVAVGAGFMVTGYMVNDYEADYKRMIFCGGMGLATGAAYHYAEGTEATAAVTDGGSSGGSSPTTTTTTPGSNPAAPAPQGPGPSPNPTAPGPSPDPSR
jgi:hypothetical protein